MKDKDILMIGALEMIEKNLTTFVMRVNPNLRDIQIDLKPKLQEFRSLQVQYKNRLTQLETNLVTDGDLSYVSNIRSMIIKATHEQPMELLPEIDRLNKFIREKLA
jgi:hypothetical protein